MLKQTNKFFLIFSNLFCSSLFFILLSANFVIPYNSNELSNLVYCPLQKTWIKKTTETLLIRSNPLDQICMSDSEKQHLTFKIVQKNAFAIDEKGVFDTLEKGDKVLNDYQDFPNLLNLPNLPNQNLAKLRHSFFVLNTKNGSKTDSQINSQTVSFEQLSRPPTILNATKFYFQRVYPLTKISRNINPRSPPIFS